MDLEGQGSQKVSVMGKLKKSIPDDEHQAPINKVNGGGLRKTPSNKVTTSKYSSFKDSGKKRNSATPVSPNSRGAHQVISLANSRSATAQNLYQLSNIKGSVVQKNLNLALGSYEQG